MANTRKELTERRSGLFIIPEEETFYVPPEDYPKGAQVYLRYLARTRQVTTSGALARIGGSMPSTWRRDPIDGGLPGFAEEEESAKEAFVDWQESSMFQDVSEEKGMPRLVGRMFLLKSLRADYAEKKEVKHKGGVAVSWLDTFGDE